MGVELVDTTRLWMRRASILEPEWVERVAPHLCESHYSGARWDREQGLFTQWNASCAAACASLITGVCTMAVSIPPMRGK